MIDPQKYFSFSTTQGESHSQSGRVTLEIKNGWNYMDGHFPGEPIFPGVAMIDACLLILKEYQPSTATHVPYVESAKYMATVTPGSTAEISWEKKDNKWQFEWSVISNGQSTPCASIKIGFN